MADEVEIVVSDKFISRGGFGAAKKGLNDLSADAAKAEKSAEKMNDEISNGFSRKGGTGKISAEVDKLGGELAKSGRSAGESAGGGFGEGMSSRMSSGAKGIGGALSGALSVLPGIGSLAGAGVGAAFSVGLTQHLEIGAARGQLKAQFGMTEAEAATSGKVAGDLYANGLGSSIGETSVAVASVGRAFKGLATEGTNSLDSVSKGALTVSKVFGTDVNAIIRSTSQLLKNGLAPDATTALDIVATGFQKGMDVGGDFLDTIDEYSPFFKRLGLNAQEGLGLVNQFLEAGARNADFAADAIKEFSLKAIDGSKTTIQAYKDIGLDADLMAQKVAAGGPAAKEALGQVISALQGMKDPVAQNTAGVGLFGTKWEDTVRDILPSLDLTKTGFENVGGSVDKMNKAIGETDASKLDQLGRKLEGIAEKGAGFALDWDKITGADRWIGTNEKINENNKLQDENNALLAKRAGLSAEAASSQDNFNKQLDSGNYQQKIGIATAAELGSANGELFAAQQQLLAGNQKLTEATGNNQAANESNLQAYLRLRDGGYAVADSLLNAATKMDDSALAATRATVKVDALGNAVISMPGQKDIAIDAKTLAADAALQGTINRIAAIQSKTVTISVQEIRTANEYSSSVGGKSGYAHGGITSRAATGGQRGGNVTMNERGGESVRLPDGSTVMPAGSTRALEQRWAEGGGGGEVTISFDTSGITDRSFVNALIGMLRVNGKKVPGLTVAA